MLDPGLANLRIENGEDAFSVRELKAALTFAATPLATNETGRKGGPIGSRMFRSKT